MHSIQENLSGIDQRIAAAAARSGRQAPEIQLVAVSKTHPAETVREAIEAGCLLFGESKVQEAKAKIPLLPGRARWHFIGHLQKNKIRHALPLFECFHSVDSTALATEIDRIAAELGLFPRVLLEVNVAAESSKFGFQPDTLRREINGLLELPRLQIEGLMTIPPPGPDAASARPHFAALRQLRDELANDCGVPFTELSMGMSGDFEMAIEEGATLVRVGTAIFGQRRSSRPGPD